MDHLIAKALQYKKNPFEDKMLGQGKKIGLLFLNPKFAYTIQHTGCCTESRNGTACI